ncbi:NO-inducible flavohemoprotein [Metabacillus litoralis]|uniref:NO-inducible flavohemoprotein n=1 Tax=Metabacillus TaxID=2675233 RepID=UPI001B9CCCF5|nr:NO-inducible flavohemoprotein [Metabacillus litoralis]MCM3162071.1 NO-inducible flavohemoprotein [Metabacillus litoralis]MCM3411405.1 NO-inducible flavohemoprotein [Metabacillus litoralis]UHA60464.1 NO-inducible flavohemoprotein [Metabacillus litoralis]
MLSNKTIEIVKSTAPVLAERGTEITTHFYKSLFKDYPELLNIFNHANQKQGRQQAALANTVYAAATYIDQLEVLLPAVKQIAHKHRSLNVKKEHYPIVGEYLLKAIKEVLGDAATPDIIEAWGEAYQVIAQVFIDVEQEMYDQAKEEAWDEFKPFRVVNKVKESSLITSFYLEPVDGSKVPNFIPGQYVTVRLSIPGEKYLFNRQYSLSDAPGKNTFRISVKRERDHVKEDGMVSNYLHDFVNVNDEIELTAPAGDFVLENQKHQHVHFISGGVGITPMMSMLNYLADSQDEREITFIHAAKNGEVHAFAEETQKSIQSLANAKECIIYETTNELDRKNQNFIAEGYLNAELLNKLIDKNGAFYICGPVAFMKNVIGYLEDLGVKTENIHYEFFGPSVSLKDYQNA